MNISTLTTLVTIIILYSCIISTEGRGGRGGGRFGGRYRGSRSSFRSSSRYRSKFSSYHSLSTSNVRTAILAGTIFGATRWRLRRPNYYHNDHDLPKICFNDKYVTNVYGNVSYYGRFICPKDYQRNEYNYCCGEEGLQYCCTFWDDTGRVVGVSFGIAGGVGIIATVIGVVICIMRKKRRKRQEANTQDVSWNSSNGGNLQYPTKSPQL